MKKATLLIIALALPVSCGEAPQPMAPAASENGTIIYEDFTTRITRVFDKDAGIVCYVSLDGGIDCMPASETRLDSGR